jgi:aspartate/methionine/tyrosine aminotransferase
LPQTRCRGLDPLVGGRQSDADVGVASRAVERAGGHQDAELGQPLYGALGGLVRRRPQVQPGDGVVDPQARRLDGRAQDGAPPAVAFLLDGDVLVVASDECYAELGWEGEWADGVPSVLDPRVCGDSHEGLLAVYSLSKQSNLAGYRAGFVAGDPVLVDRLLQVRKHAGMIVPLPVQRAMVAALGDDEHVAVQRERYARRRAVLRAAVEAAGLRVDHSVAGLYLWATADEPAAITVDRLAELGILVAPGTFYGPGGASHVRIALTATDERIGAAAARLQQAPLRH